MKHLIHFSSNVSNQQDCVDMGRLLFHEYFRWSVVLSRWVDYLPFDHRRIVYDSKNKTEDEFLSEIDKTKDFQRYVSLTAMADIMRYQFVNSFGMYVDNNIFCVFVYKHGNTYEFEGWRKTKYILGSVDRCFFSSTTQDVIFNNEWGYIDEETYDDWVEKLYHE